MKKLLSIIIAICAFIYTPLFAQTQTLSTLPSLNPTVGVYGGMSFEITTTKHLHLVNLEVAMGTTGDSLPLDIYYKFGAVQTSPGVPPTIDSANGWIFYGTDYVDVELSHTPLSTSELNIFLPPGTYGFYLISPGNRISGVNRSSTSVFSYADASGFVTLNVDTNHCYGGLPPNPIFNFVFAGGIIYDTYTPFANDITAYTIDSPVFKCAGSNSVVTTLRNYGTTQINPVTLNWTINGSLQTPVIYSQMIDTIGGVGPFEAQIVLGNFNFLADQNYDIAVWTSSPNGTTDPNPTNDSSFISYSPAMSGTYTINTTGGNGLTSFGNFNEAATALKTRGVCGPVVFNAAPGIYNEHVAIDAIPGSSAANTVTFQKDPALTGTVEMLYSSPSIDDSNYVVKLNGCSYVIIDGIEMTNNGIDNTTSIWYEGAAHHNIVRNCRLFAPRYPFSTGSDYAVIYCQDAEGADYNTIESNYIDGGSAGIYYRGTSSTDRANGVQILNNEIWESERYGMYFREHENLTIEGNIIQSQSSFTGSCYGLYLRDILLATVQGNEIKSTGTWWPLYGIYLREITGTSTQAGMIANNLIHAGSPLSNSGTISGMYSEDCEFVNIVHNNIAVEGTNMSSSAIKLTGTGYNTEVYNNNFLHYGDGYAMLMDSLPGSYVSDYNNLATNGATLCYYNFGRGVVPDLTTWKLTPNGANSINSPAIFTNLDSLRTCDNRIVNKGNFLSYAASDIDDEPRNTTAPDIGADEFSLDNPTLDIGDELEFCGDSVELTALSNSTIKFGNFNWSTDETSKSIMVSDSGLYSLTIDNGCGVSATDDVHVSDISPFVAFDADVQPNSYQVDFTNNSENGVAYSWDFGDGDTSLLENPSHTYAASGNYTVTLTVMNPCDTLTKDTTLTISVGIGELSAGSISVFPNPSNDLLNIRFSEALEGKVQMKLISITGQEMLNDQWLMVNGNTAQMDVSAFSKGLYFLKLTNEQGTYTERIVIQ